MFESFHPLDQPLSSQTASFCLARFRYPVPLGRSGIILLSPGHRNVHFHREDTNQPEQPLPKQKISAEHKKAIEAEGDVTRLTLDPRVPDKTVCINAEISLEEQAELLQFLDKNSDIFAWSTSD
jgi:hypothetical protein